MSGNDEKKLQKDFLSRAYYPVWLDLKGKSCFVIGGGHIAERKISSLLEAGADVTVISPKVTFVISQCIKQGLVNGLIQSYHSEDSVNAFLIIAATNVAYVNEQVYRDAAARGQLINRVDAPEQSNFLVPAVLRRGKLAIAVSTSGASPSLAAEIRQKLEQQYGEEYELYVEFLGELRMLVQQRIEDPGQRRLILKQALESDILTSIRVGTLDKELWFERLLGDCN
jgi:precorrin-2 dehydrogenase/sirohydrochlorin ferrochelatase